MNPRVYVDLRILPSGGDARAPGVDPRASGLVFGAVHRHMRAHPGRFALALPDGRGFMAVLRVFADTREELDGLAEALQDSPLVRDYAVVGYPKRVPEDFDGPWLQYRRYRIPTRRADRKEGAPCRQRRIASRAMRARSRAAASASRLTKTSSRPGSARSPIEMLPDAWSTPVRLRTR